MDDEIDKLMPPSMPADLQHWNIEDLQNFVAAMTAKIAEIEAEIAKKQSVQSAAAALFKNDD